MGSAILHAAKNGASKSAPKATPKKSSIPKNPKGKPGVAPSTRPGGAARPKSRPSGSSALPADTRDVRDLAATFEAIGGLHRIAIVLMLEAGPRRLKAVVADLPTDYRTASNQLLRLRSVGVVGMERDGRESVYGLTPKGEALVAAIRSFRAALLPH